MDLPLSIVQDLYRIGTLKWISTIKESTDIISLTRNIFEFAAKYKIRWHFCSFDINYVKSFINQGEEGIEKLAKLTTLMYLVMRYAKKGDEIDNWGNEEYRKLNPPIIVWDDDINSLTLTNINDR